MLVTFPNSPYELFKPFEPAGDQPEAIDKLIEGLSDGLAYQTLLGVTGSGKTYTMANVIARTGRPALVLAPNKTLAAQLYSEFREFFPNNAIEYFVSYYDYYQPEAYVPSRDLYIEKDSSINEHIEQMRLSATKAILERPDCVIVATVSAIYGIGDPSEYHSMILHVKEGDRADAARRDQAADRDAVLAQRGRLPPRHVPRARRRPRHLPGRARRERGAHLAVRRRGRVAAAVRPADRAHPAADPALHRVPVEPLRDRAPEGARRDRGDQGRARRAEGVLRLADEADRGAADRAAHALRPRDDDRDRLLQGHRELLAAPVRAQGRRAAADADRLPAVALADVHRREPRDDSADGRHVQGRPRAQGEPRQLRLPPAVGARQPAAALRRVRAAAAADDLRVGDARRVRADARGPGRRAGRAADGAGRSGAGRAPGADAGRRPALRDLAARREERARAGDDADQADGRGPHRLPQRARRQGALPAFGHRHGRARRDHPRPAAQGIRRAGRHQPAARGTRHSRGVAGGDPRRGQGGLPARRALADPDDRPRRAAHQRHGDPLRRQDDRFDARRDRRDRSPARQADCLERSRWASRRSACRSASRT